MLVYVKDVISAICVLAVFIVCASAGQIYSDEDMNRSPKHELWSSVYVAPTNETDNNTELEGTTGRAETGKTAQRIDADDIIMLKKVKKLRARLKELRALRARSSGGRAITDTKNSRRRAAKGKHNHATKKGKSEYALRKSTKADKTRHEVKRPHKMQFARSRDGDISSTKTMLGPLRSNKSTHKKHEFAGADDGSERTGTALQLPPSSTLGPPRREREEMELLESLKRMHIDLVKQKILRLLRREKTHEVYKPLPMLSVDFLVGLAQSDEPRRPIFSRHLPLPTQAVVFAEEETLPCPQPTAKCVFFDLAPFAGREVESAELWVYKEYDEKDHYNHTFVFYELEKPRGNSAPGLRKVAGAIQTGIKGGWLRFTARQTATFWVDKPHRNHGMQILCKTCKPGGDRLTPIATSLEIRPVLVVTFRPGTVREKRSTLDVCHGRNPVCCKQPITVDLSEFNWIIFPKTIETSFCRGTCQNSHRQIDVLTHHSQFVKLVEEEVPMCCAPTEMETTSLLVREPHSYVKQELELRVTECGCAT